MCNYDVTTRKRSLEEFEQPYGDFNSMLNPLKKQFEVQQPSYVSLMRANLFRQQQVNAAKTIIKPEKVRSNSATTSSEEDTNLLPETFQPGNWHVIYGREKSHKEHVGNKRLRVLIANNLKAYVEAPSRREKSKIIDEVASQIRCYGGFVKKTTGGRWLSIGPAQAREKVGHSFRDCMKVFKGNKPKSKEAQWESAQNAIFANLNLRVEGVAYEMPPPVSLPQEEEDVLPASCLPKDEPLTRVVSDVVVSQAEGPRDPLPLEANMEFDFCGLQECWNALELQQI